jgi:hypothetical protein
MSVKSKPTNPNVRVCSKCGCLREIKDFYHTNVGGRWYFCSECKRCKLTRNRKGQLRRDYNVTPTEAANIYSSGCEVCGSTTNLCIDHDHSSGKVRGCLCRECNQALGLLKDNLGTIKNLLNYLEKNNAQR